MYVVTVHFHVKPEHVTDFQAAMLVNARSSVEKEPGCRRFDVTVDEKDPAHFFLFGGEMFVGVLEQTHDRRAGRARQS